jgi:hypothetical protein
VSDDAGFSRCSSVNVTRYGWGKTSGLTECSQLLEVVKEFHIDYIVVLVLYCETNFRIHIVLSEKTETDM